MCGMGEACVADAGGMAVLDDLVEGTGLFASLALTSTGTPIIGCYDRLNGALRMAEGFLPGVYGVRTLGADPMRPRDVGAHVSVAVGPQDRIGLAYMDQTNDDLLLLHARRDRSRPCPARAPIRRPSRTARAARPPYPR
jgi:hypothetical protein